MYHKTACFFFLQLPAFHSAERACKKTSSLTGVKRKGKEMAYPSHHHTIQKDFT